MKKRAWRVRDTERLSSSFLFISYMSMREEDMRQAARYIEYIATPPGWLMPDMKRVKQHMARKE